MVSEYPLIIENEAKELCRQDLATKNPNWVDNGLIDSMVNIHWEPYVKEAQENFSKRMESWK